MNDKILYLNSTLTTKGVTPASDGTIESILIEGFASTNDVDRDEDIIPTSVWETGIKEYLKNPVILGFHNHNEPIGRMLSHRIDETGLWIEARISSASEKIFNLVKDGVVTAFSVGFRILDAEYRPEMDVFVIKELELHEISVVSVGANRNTLFNLSKAFDSADEYKSFKLQFATEAPAKELGNLDADRITTKKEEWNMDPKELEKMLAAVAANTANAVISAQKELADKAAAEKAAADKVEAEIAARVKAAVDIKTGETGAEKLLAEVEARLAKEAESNKSVIDGLQAALAEKAVELDAIQKSKMTFSEKGGDGVSYAEKEIAVLLGIVTRKGTTGTAYGKKLVEKAGAHVPSATWELEVSMNMENEVRRRLVVAPTLRAIPMQTNVMTLPINPEAGLGTWVTNAQFGTTNSTGAAQTHALTAVTLNAYKVATLEYLAFEEEEDSLIAIMPTIRDGMIRRLSRAVDRAFLRGAGAGADPVKGLTEYDAAAAVTLAVATAATVAKLQLLRKDLGAWGLEPGDIRYVVSTEVYYSLLEDTSFQTMDKVGDKATLLTGQIGAIGNTPVLVSAEFAALGVGADAAICYAPANFVVGNQRGLRFDTDDLVETQRKVMVASLRTGMTQLTTNLGGGVSKLEYVA